ncbi:MAG: vitamin K epoxide reductase family protein [Candidatus Hydrogenedentota bacterium]
MHEKKACAWARICSLGLTILGLGVSGYLLGRTLMLMMSQNPDAFDVCSAVFGTGCDKTLLSPTSWVLGIPLAGWGVVYYAFLLVLFAMAGALEEEFALQAHITALLVSVAGLAGSIVLAVVLLAGWAPFCPLCMVVHGINVLLAPALKMRIRATWREILGSMVSAGRSLFGNAAGRSPMWRWRLAGFVTVGLAALVLYQGVFIVCERWVYESRGVFNPHRLLSTFATIPPADFTTDPHDARKGPKDAPVEVTAFTSFHCPACRQFSREMRVVMERFPGQVALVFKHFPLAAPCNPVVRRGQQGEGGACETSYAAVAAMRQGKFWEFHDTLYRGHFPPEKGTVLRVAKEIGLDIDRFNADRQSEAVRAAVREDTELGARLVIQETPAIFINKRRVPGIGARSLEVIIADIVKQHEN